MPMPNEKLIFDFDSTLISVEALDELVPLLCERLGEPVEPKLEAIQRITELAMNGELSFEESLQQRFALMPIVPEDIEQLIPILKKKITASMIAHRAFFKEHASRIYVISGGFEEYIIPVVAELGIWPHHVFANNFVPHPDGNLTFDTTNALSKPHGKVIVLRTQPFKEKIIMIGDGYTDYETKKFGVADSFLLYAEHVNRQHKIPEADAVVFSFEELLLHLNG